MKKLTLRKLSNKLLLVGLILFMGLLMISFASAFEFDNVKDTVSTTFDGKLIKDYPLLETYSPIKISNAFDLPLIGEKIYEI